MGSEICDSRFVDREVCREVSRNFSTKWFCEVGVTLQSQTHLSKMNEKSLSIAYVRVSLTNG